MEKLIGCFVVAVLAHTIWSRLAPGHSRLGSFLLIGAMAGFALAALLSSSATPLATLIAMLLTYMMLCELYVFCFTMVLGSVSANLLLRLRRRDLPLSNLHAEYSGAGMTALRVQRLVDAQLLASSDGHGWALTARGTRLARALSCLRHYFRHGTQA